MDRERLRRQLIEACDRILSLRRWLVSEEERRLARALRPFWQGADADTLDRVLSHYREARGGPDAGTASDPGARPEVEGK